MAQQPGRRLAPVLNVARQYRLQPFRCREGPVGFDRLPLALQAARPILQPFHLLLAESCLDLPRIDERLSLAPPEIHAVEFAAPEREAGDHERLAMPARHFRPIRIAA